MRQMSRRERLQAAITRQPVDRVPYAVWRHFPSVDRSSAGLAQATLRFHDHYGSDFLKITPHGGYAVEAWGCVEGEEVLPDGHRACASCAVKTAEDWKRIRPLDPMSAEGYGQQIETIIRLGFDRRIGDAPVLPTLFSPLSLAHKLSGGRLATDQREHRSAAPTKQMGLFQRPADDGGLIPGTGLSGPPSARMTAATLSSGVFIVSTQPGPTIRPVPPV
jgi:uroporphyrinogen decarboxylase